MITFDNRQYGTVTELAAASGYSVSHLREMSRQKSTRGVVILPRLHMKLPGGGYQYLYDLKRCMELLATADGARRRGVRMVTPEQILAQKQARLLDGL